MKHVLYAVLLYILSNEISNKNIQLLTNFEGDILYVCLVIENY